MVAARLANLTQADAARIKHDATANLQSQTRAEAAEKLNVSDHSANWRNGKNATQPLLRGISEFLEDIKKGR